VLIPLFAIDQPGQHGGRVQNHDWRRQGTLHLLATTLLPEQPNPAKPIKPMVSSNPQFVVELDHVGFAQIGAGLNS
jgi:hypothetical protein